MFRLTGLLLVVAGAIFTWLGAEDGIATFKRSAAAEDVIGQIQRFDPDPAGDGYLPVAGFVTDEGQRIEVKLPPVKRPEVATGAPVHLIYPPGRPDLAETGDLMAVWGPSAIPVGGGLLGIVVGLGMATSRRRRPEELPRLHLLIRLPLFLVAFGLVYLAWQDYAAVVDTLNRFPRTEGRVIALDNGAPVVRFRTGDGRIVDYTDTSVPRDTYREGEAVTIGYAKSNPAGARIESFGEVWAGPAFWGVIAGLALMIALFAASIRRGKGAEPAEPAPVVEPPPEAPVAAPTLPPAEAAPAEPAPPAPAPPALPPPALPPLAPLPARLRETRERREPVFDRDK
ncbi:DUF3592 domain-containing protein [Zavarzinia aquatilis]|uniref:DUF3592 domain-containing protein n=1 Tax=Zavarzinia aquatilis TaxID=2211142 RepID=A0A317E658_9PROT|nr:DUF3592 domain-containing protein [Zavarzinia aquatilis]PWR22588.1 hypothetical protein DKG74_11995 [Zavarzinia aquatilis]